MDLLWVSYHFLHVLSSSANAIDRLLRDTFIDNVCVQVVERQFLDNLEKIVPSVGDISKEEFEKLIRPDPETAKKRREIETRVEKLQEAAKLLQ